MRDHSVNTCFTATRGVGESTRITTAYLRDHLLSYPIAGANVEKIVVGETRIAAVLILSLP